MPDVILPDDLATLGDDELESLETEATAAFDGLMESDPENISALTDLANSIQAIRAEKASRVTAREEAAAEREALRLAIHGESDAPEAGDEPEEAEAEGEETEDEAAEPEGVLVTAGGGSSVNLALIKRYAPKAPLPPKAARPSIVMTAAADVPGIPGGAQIDVGQLATALHDRARALPISRDGNGQRVVVASIAVPIPEADTVDDLNDVHSASVLDRVRNPKALVAGGGWCAPSEVLYDFFDISAADGLVDLPTVRVTRGGFKYPVSPSLADVASALWTWTEQNDIDASTAGAPDPTKPCLRIPCPTWSECRLEAEGLCLTHGNLSDRALPELTRTFINLTMNSHLHRVSAAILTKMATLATDVTIGAGALTSDAHGDLMGAIDLQVADYRSQFRMSDGATLEIVLPTWTREMLRTNLAKRAGVDLLSVSDARIQSFFSDRNVRVQYVQDWQPLYSASPATTWPSTIKFMLYAAGTFVKGDGGSIDLGVVRDSTLNATNDHTAAWSEQFYCVSQVGHASREVTVTFTPDGVTACCA